MQNCLIGANENFMPVSQDILPIDKGIKHWKFLLFLQCKMKTSSNTDSVLLCN